MCALHVNTLRRCKLVLCVGEGAVVIELDIGPMPSSIATLTVGFAAELAVVSLSSPITAAPIPDECYLQVDSQLHSRFCH